MRTSTRLLALGSGALLIAGVLAGCAAAANSGSMSGMGGTSGMNGGSLPMMTPSGDHNAADGMFAQMMIPHHQQAIDMADTLLGKSGIDPRVTSLAQQIKDAQGPEITKMQGWLTAWGMPTMIPTGMGVDGGMSDGDMQALDAASGTAAAKLFLTQMITHHQGAITMAKDELSNGSNADAKALAQQIIDAQTTEIATMQSLLATL